MEKQRYRGGRPRLNEAEKSERIVKVRFTNAEHQQLLDRKNKTQLPDLSKYIRSLCLGGAVPLKTQLTTYENLKLGLLRELRADLLRIGVNINQATRRINATTDYFDLRHEVNRIAQELGSLEARMIQLSEKTEPSQQPENTDDCPNQ
jgi:hypothetical protein